MSYHLKQKCKFCDYSFETNLTEFRFKMYEHLKKDHPKQFEEYEKQVAIRRRLVREIEDKFGKVPI